MKIKIKERVLISERKVFKTTQWSRWVFSVVFFSLDSWFCCCRYSNCALNGNYYTSNFFRTQSTECSQIFLHSNSVCVLRARISKWTPNIVLFVTEFWTFFWCIRAKTTTNARINGVYKTFVWIVDTHKSVEIVGAVPKNRI